MLNFLARMIVLKYILLYKGHCQSIFYHLSIESVPSIQIRIICYKYASTNKINVNNY